MASEAELEVEISGFKIVQSGKVLVDAQTSDSVSHYSPAKWSLTQEGFCYASATKFLDPNPQAIF